MTYEKYQSQQLLSQSDKEDNRQKIEVDKVS